MGNNGSNANQTAMPMPPLFRPLMGNFGNLIQPIMRQARLIWLKFRPDTLRRTPTNLFPRRMPSTPFPTGQGPVPPTARMTLGSNGMQTNAGFQRALQMMRQMPGAMQNRNMPVDTSLNPSISLPLFMLLNRKQGNGGNGGEGGGKSEGGAEGAPQQQNQASPSGQLLAALLARRQMEQMAAQRQMGVGGGMNAMNGMGSMAGMGNMGLGGLGPLGGMGSQLSSGMFGGAQLNPPYQFNNVPLWQTKLPLQQTNPMDGLLEAMLMKRLVGGGEGAGGGGEGGAAGGGGEGGAAAGGGEEAGPRTASMGGGRPLVD